jgi:cobalt-zinc-cadmium efflux system protein
MAQEEQHGDGGSHSHGHDSSHRHARHVHGVTSGLLLRISLVITLVFVLGEAIAGYFAHSLALMSDAGHNLSDALALGLAAYAIWIAKKPANAQRTYGYHRVGILAALLNTVTLIVIAISILVGAYRLFRAPEHVDATLMLWVAAVALLMNTVIAYLLHGGAQKSMNMRAAFIHMAGDALSSLAVLAAGFIVLKTGWPYADPSVSVLIAAFILFSSWGIVRDATDVLLEGSPKDLDMEKMVKALRQVPHVKAVHDLHAWTVSDGMNCLSCHVVVGEGCTMPLCSKIIQAINELLYDDFQIAHPTVQIELEGDCISPSQETPLFCGEAALTDKKK